MKGGGGIDRMLVDFRKENEKKRLFTIHKTFPENPLGN